MELAANRQVLEEGLVGLEDGFDPARLETLMRAAHSIKGAARIVGLSPVVSLAHAMEDVLEAARRQGASLDTRRADALLAANDYLGLLARTAPAELPDLAQRSAAQSAGLEQALRDLPAAQDAQPPASPAPDPQPAPLVAAEQRQDGEVRLSAGLLDRLMGLAGQCVVESGALGRMFGRVRDGRRALLDLADLLAGLRADLCGHQAQARLESARSLLRQVTQEHQGVIQGLDGLTQRVELLSDRLYSQVLGSRMRPFGECARPLPRLVRELARELGKKARFSLEGSRTAVDRDILDRLDAPLMHLARNSLDHGLESPEERALAGKPEKGRVTLSARHAAGHLEVRFSDDGRGVDVEALRARVTARGLADEEMAARLSADELFEFLFLPGFTTTASVTEVSGRGVGLDVVKTMLQEVGGAVRVESAPGAGTAFVLKLPVSRSVVRAMVFTAAGEPYALALSRIGRVVSAAPEDVLSIEGRQYLSLDGVNVGLVPAAQLLGRPGALTFSEELPVVVLEGGEGRFGLAVDALQGERDLVVHPLDERLGKVPNVSAASILDDGAPVLILDDADLVRSIQSMLESGRPSRVQPGPGRQEERGPRRVLVVDDSLTVREVERQLLSGRGYEVRTAVDGMEGLALARMGGFDLIVTDVDMPRMTGIELTRRVKADPALSRTPVLIVSYKDRQEDRMAGLEAGADYYLAKSGFRDDALLDAVRDLIGDP